MANGNLPVFQITVKPFAGEDRRVRTHHVKSISLQSALNTFILSREYDPGQHEIISIKKLKV